MVVNLPWFSALFSASLPAVETCWKREPAKQMINDKQLFFASPRAVGMCWKRERARQNANDV